MLLTRDPDEIRDADVFNCNCDHRYKCLLKTIEIDFIRNWLLMGNLGLARGTKVNRYVSHIRRIQCLYGVQLVKRYVLFNRMK